MSTLQPCFLIPVYNHPQTIAAVCQELAVYDLPILLVDDGSDPACAAVLDELQANQGHSLLRLPHNAGKGAAVRTGLFAAQRQGFTHALQVDADGQHDIADLQAFLEGMQQQPNALIAGYPQYDDSVSRLRFYGRYATHIWVWINTLSLDIKDTMCGARLYPLDALIPMLERHSCGNRMDFDTEVLVRWHWAGHAVCNLPVHVRYPADGISHFRLWRDNLLLTRMHTRLFFGMLLRLPRLLARKLRRSRA
ncbi:glycosyltransferase family 2 protein [Halopseudomonas salegens]|uniref:Glycosyltransferase involved in cell wall bisynthesis n=1 Tax=Halopseudomonas salegens TaxID=1434072 RepID=A0A1H2GX45_9GAMM|nr:glycosyltransferase family 2 protein [Halopseudomonas salegens]SDU23888.1 Glycosyltransferase involved in cell wall bisynthesis [Halopseudomonas salegens]